MSLSWEELEKELGIVLEIPTQGNSKIQREIFGDILAPVEGRTPVPSPMADTIEAYEATTVIAEPNMPQEPVAIIEEVLPVERVKKEPVKKEKNTAIQEMKPQLRIGGNSMRARARQGFVWAEIMAPPLAKRR